MPVAATRQCCTPGTAPSWHPPVFSGSRAMPGMGVWLVRTGTSSGTLGTETWSMDFKTITGKQRSPGDMWDIKGCGVRGLTVGPGCTDPCQLAAQQGQLQGHMLVPALGCDSDVAGSNRGDEGVEDLPMAVRVSFKDLPERVKREPMAECPWAWGLQPLPLSSPHAHLALLGTAASVGFPVPPVAAGRHLVGPHVVVVVLRGALGDDAWRCRSEPRAPGGPCCQ